ncbi:hypothetical protein ACFE04_024021 [Oxalis oulophora]
MAMEKNMFNRSQAVMLSLALTLIIALLCSSLKPTHLYFVIINLLIISLGAEAGLLSFLLSKPHNNHHHHHVDYYSTSFSLDIIDHDNPKITSTTTGHAEVIVSDKQKKATPLEKSSSEEGSNKVKKVCVRKCPSMPSIFFIGNVDEEEININNNIGGQQQQDHELFNKAETFIGNFYKQLKMQREESWNRIHDFYHKAF